MYNTIEATVSIDADSIISAVAQDLDLADVASEIRASELAEYIDYRELAGEVDLSDVSNYVDMNELARLCGDDDVATDMQDLRDRVCTLEDQVNQFYSELVELRSQLVEAAHLLAGIER